MKTQLLEDIGENAPLSLTPPGKPGLSTTDNAAPKAPPARGTPLVSETPQPAQAAAPPDLDSVFEEIAALEAQYVAPVPNHEPALAPAEPVRPVPQEAPLEVPAMAAAESTLARDPAQGATVPRDSVFDFTLPLQEPHASAPFTPAPAWPRKPRQRSLLWATGLLSAALLVAGGWWLYEEQRLAGSLALVADGAKAGAKAALPVPQAVEPPAMASKQADAAPAVPPLVMLEPKPSAAAEASPPAPAPASPEQSEPETTGTPEPDAQPTSAFPLPKSLSRAARGESDAAAPPAPRKTRPAPDRQRARASAVEAKTPATGEGAMTALLRACREHGYHAAQCVKQGCSLTQYGFACRGR